MSQDTQTLMHQIFEDYKQFVRKSFPEMATYDGDHRYNDQLTDLSDEGIQARANQCKEFLGQLERLDYKSLDHQEQLNYDLFKNLMEESIEETQFNAHYMPIEQLQGHHISFPQIVEYHPLNHLKDYQDYFARLEGFAKQIDDIIANMKKGIETRIVQPDFVMKQVLDQIQNFLDAGGEKSPFYRPLLKEDCPLSDSDKEQVSNQLKGIIENVIQTSYTKLYQFIKEEYLPQCRSSEGLWDIPNGAEYYQFLIKKYTTPELTADEIHEIGLKEVERLKVEKEKIKKEMGFEGTLHDFIVHLRDDPKYSYKTREEMLEDYNQCLERCYAIMPQLVTIFPKTLCEIKEIEAYRAASSPQAYYYPVPEDGSRPGYFYVNTYDLPSRPKYALTCLTLHEAVPGHHHQIAIAKERDNLPYFRKNLFITAYLEGWGLYSEYLGYETNMYDDPLQHYGALTFETWRACRLVVDTGLHYKKWTREQAVSFMKKHMANSELDIRSEVDRYLVLQGQALSYKIGELKIKQLRQKATEKLGDRFDVKSFHDTLLKNGALPLSILEKEVEQWVAECLA